ncbi:MAG: ABC transporter ATP-binding protein/permease [Tissierellaceae bacterium]|nr:ABC transporter ATP-binding protein/permease [Tissierellaceae bacterium]
MKEKYNIFLFFIRLVRKMRPNIFILRGIYSIFKTLEILLIMYIPSMVILLLSNNFTYEKIIMYILGTLALLLALRIGNKILNRNAFINEEKFSQEFLRDISNKIVNVPFSQIEDSEFIAKKEEALFPIKTQGTIENLFRTVPTIVQATIILISVLSILLVYEPILMVFSILLAGISFGLCRSMINHEAKTALRSARQNKEYVYYLRVMRSSEIAKDVRIYKMQPFFIKKLASLFGWYVQDARELYRSREFRGLINQVLSVILLGTIYGYLISKVFSSSISGAVFILLVNATVNFNSQINVFLSELLLLNQQIIYLKPLMEFYDLIETKNYKGNIVLEDKIESMEFRDVFFKYPRTDEYVLKGCSFKIDCSENLSIVGRNGSGKTTIIKLLSRLYKPQSGEIFVNGINIQEYEEKSYLKQLSIIFQDFKTFSYSIRENIVLDKDFDDNKLNDALEKSELKKELDPLPKGVETKLSRHDDQDTISLSKGQEQKLVIARSIYEEGSLIILDEPTASLDPIAEEEVYRHFKSITNNKLAIFISHRLSSCRFSDKIIYLSEGKVSESGNHYDLMKLGGDYAGLFNLQASKYR